MTKLKQLIKESNGDKNLLSKILNSSRNRQSIDQFKGENKISKKEKDLFS